MVHGYIFPGIIFHRTIKKTPQTKIYTERNKNSFTQLIIIIFVVYLNKVVDIQTNYTKLNLYRILKNANNPKKRNRFENM